MRKIILALFILFIALIGISSVSAHDVCANDVKDNPELSKVIGSIDAIENMSGKDLPEDDIILFIYEYNFYNNTAKTGEAIYPSNDTIYNNRDANNSNIEDIPTIDENRIAASIKMNENNTQVVNYGDRTLEIGVDATIVDEQGNPCAYKDVTFVVSNGVAYTRITDENGVAHLRTRLTPGEHTITSIYNGVDVPNKITITG